MPRNKKPDNRGLNNWGLFFSCNDASGVGSVGSVQTPGPINRDPGSSVNKFPHSGFYSLVCKMVSAPPEMAFAFQEKKRRQVKVQGPSELVPCYQKNKCSQGSPLPGQLSLDFIGKN